MSGGSYGYLYLAVDIDGLGGRREDLARMEARLRELGHAAAAERTSEVRAALDCAEDLAKGLRTVWRAVEWCDSGDSGPDDVAEVVAKWLGGVP